MCNCEKIVKNKLGLFFKNGMDFCLENVYKILYLFNNPQDKIKSIHIAGTNGKGSICAMLSSVLNNSKKNKLRLNVGMFTSPHLICLRERIKINNKKISKESFINYLDKIFFMIEKNNIYLTEFEFFTVMAFLYFYEMKLDISIIETGLGGRLDSTNVILKPIVSIIGEISYDHVKILGNNLEKIAYEKSGIIKKNSNLVLMPNQNHKVFKIIKNQCKKNNCRLIYYKNTIKIKENTSLLIDKYETFIYKKDKYEIPLFGVNQSLNLFVVLITIKILKKYFKISKKSIKLGLKKTFLNARFQIINKNPLIILDGAHNESGAKVLKLSLDKYLKNVKKIAIFSVMSDKNVEKILFELDSVFEKIIITKSTNPRNIPIKKLFEIAKKFTKEVIISEYIPDALKKSLNFSYTIVIFGSLYLAGDILNCQFIKTNFKLE